jgi:hypothetical protein
MTSGEAVEANISRSVDVVFVRYIVFALIESWLE